jgi:hypothetical protein
MSTGSDDHRRQPSEPTFADIMNGFSFDAGRSPRRRRWGRRRGADVELNDDDGRTAAQPPGQQAPAPPSPTAVPPGLPTAPIEMRLVDTNQIGEETGAAAVRPYAWTRGRTKPGLDLAIEELCEQTRSVAEVAALLSLPLGVARVLLGDMAGLGFVTVHQTASSAGNTPDLALMERVLSGLRRL